MAKPSQVIMLVEDRRHEQFIFRYLRILGYEPHAMRVVRSPVGEGSAEQWVREQFAAEVQAYRGASGANKAHCPATQAVGQTPNPLKPSTRPALRAPAEVCPRLSLPRTVTIDTLFFGLIGTLEAYQCK